MLSEKSTDFQCRRELEPCPERNGLWVNTLFACSSSKCGRSENMFFIILTFSLSDAELTLADDSCLKNIGLRCAGVLCDCVVWCLRKIQSETKYQQVPSQWRSLLPKLLHSPQTKEAEYPLSKKSVFLNAFKNCEMCLFQRVGIYQFCVLI